MSKFTRTFPETITDEFWAILYENKPGYLGIDCYLTNPEDMVDGAGWRFQHDPGKACRFGNESCANKAIEILSHTSPGNGFLPPKAVKVVVTVRTDYTVELG
jgi:hypothetical protein